MNKGKLFSFFMFSAVIWACIGCSGNENKNNDIINDSIESGYRMGGSQQILSQLKQCADIATTEVTIKKIGLYDSGKSEKFTWEDPSTWKYGDRKCIIPVTIKIKYGYDLRDLTFDDIKLTDDSTAVVVYLPTPKIIDSGYNAEIEQGSVTSITTGLRSTIGHELEEEIRRKAYEAVLKEDIKSIVGNDIENNAKTLVESLIQSIGWKNVQVVGVRKEKR